MSNTRILLFVIILSCLVLYYVICNITTNYFVLYVIFLLHLLYDMLSYADICYGMLLYYMLFMLLYSILLYTFVS
jgi:hypothetical protein